MRAPETAVRQLPSGKWQARLTVGSERKSIGTYKTEKHANAALRRALTEREQGTYMDPARGRVLFGDYAPRAVAVMDLAPRTREVYASLLTKWLLPEFGTTRIDQITPLSVDEWWVTVGTGKVNRRNAYYLLRGIMRRAVEKDKLIRENPCKVENAHKMVAKTRPTMSVHEFAAIRDASAIPAVLEVMFAAHLRVAELVALNRRDVDLTAGTITINKQRQQITGKGLIERETKNGDERTVYMLQSGLDALSGYLLVNPALPSAPLFRGVKGGRIPAGTIRAEWERARAVVGLNELHLHDVRHCGLTALAPGASIRELMARAGHRTPRASMIYQHATSGRDRDLARAASERLAADHKSTEVAVVS